MATTEESARAEGAGGEAESGPVHGGKLVTRALKARGVSHLFTLSGGHLFSIYDGCVADGIELVDTRHEQAAAWAAEGFAKATRKPGIAALTAGPGVTNGMSAMAGAKFNRSPLVVLGGRAGEGRWGSGSLQEIDHLPFVAPGDQVGRDGQGHGRDPGRDRARDRRRDDPAQRPDLRRLPARRRLHGGRGRGAGGARRAGRAGAEPRGGGEGARRGRAPGDHGRDRRLLVARRGRAARARRGARDPGVPERDGARAACPPTTSSASRGPAARG